MHEANKRKTEIESACPHGQSRGACRECRAEREPGGGRVEVMVDAYARRFQELEEREIELGPEERELEAFGRQLFLDHFANPLKQLLVVEMALDGEPVRLGELLEGYLEQIAEQADDPTRAQQSLVRDLVHSIKNLDSGTWDIVPSQTAETGKANCTSAASVLTEVLEVAHAVAGIDVSYVNPYGHAANVVRFHDDSTWYADPRNGVFRELKAGEVDFEERDEFVVWGIRNPDAEIPFQHLPALKENWRLMVETFAGNMVALPATAKGEFDAVLRAVATAEELSAMQQEASEVVERFGVSDEDVQGYSRLRQQFDVPLREFRQSPDFGAASEVWRQIHAGQEILRTIGERIESDGELRNRLVEKKVGLRTYLLGDADTLETGDEDLDILLEQYRGARIAARIFLHKNRAQSEAEVDLLLEQLR